MSILQRLGAGLLVIVFASACVVPRSVARPPERPLNHARNWDSLPAPNSASSTFLKDGRFRLVLERPPLEAEPLSVANARAALTAFRASWPSLQPPPGLRLASYLPHGTDTSWQQALWQDYANRYGTARLPIPSQIEEHRFRLALQLAPKYMPDGFRDAAQELLTDPLFVTGVLASLMFYLAAWMAPEPLFTKSAAMAMTLALMLVFTAAEVKNAAIVLWSLYEQTNQARTLAELEAAAEHFGRAAGATVLRIMIMIAARQVGRLLPDVPPGGLGGLRPAPSGPVLPNGASVSSIQVAADGSLLMTAGSGMGVTAQSARQESICSDRKRDGYEAHHMATSRNSKSPLRGGPWTPPFEELFAEAGMSLNDAANIVYLKGHYGPHPKEYHQRVYDRLRLALSRCADQASCREALVAELRKLAEEICTPGSMLNSILTRLASP
ncbi:AHH domain-containing protein [Archangium violaceum]|uniref:AHH domain-containing protein n=1 Tax=Archangium violaceum TaxID=83451 RepID=UPI00194FB830|nr:AHH domain-containing protein [Archangium violaceum]QRN95471.1 AHH domain-containing protein [Archangium violaceum]